MVSNQMVRQSEIVAVTVYRSGARVTRSLDFSVSKEAEICSLLVSNLPLSLDDSSVRIRVERQEEGEAPVALDYRVALDRVSDAREPLDSLRNTLLSARAELARSERIINRLEGFQKRLLDVRLAARPQNKRGEPPISSPASSRLSWLTFRTERLLSIERRITAQKKEQRALSERVRVLEAEERASSSAVSPRAAELRKAVAVTLDTTRAAVGEATLLVDYVVPGARWSPCYSLSLARTKRDLSLSLRAQVVQKTGEDWTGVRLVLSTALPSRFTSLPELKALRVGKQQPKPARHVRPVADIDSLYRDFDAALAETHLGVVKPASEMTEQEVFSENAAALDEAAIDSFAPPDVEFAAYMEEPAETGPVKPMAPAPGAVPVASFAMKSAALPRARFGGAASGGAPPSAAFEDEPPESALSDTLLDFGNLRMAAPNASGRGRVSPLSKQAAYLELMARQQISVNVDIMRVIRLAVDHAREAEAIPLPEKHSPPAVQAGYAYSYDGEHPVDVPSDGRFHAVMLTSAHAEAKLRHVSVPRETMQVFRCLTFDNPFDAPLLPGPVEITSDGQYLPPGRIDNAPVGGEVTVWLGVEQGIKISRNIEYGEETAGLLRGHIALEHHIVIDIVNHLKSDADIEVRERVPVVREKEDNIEVSVKNAVPEWRPYEQKEALLKGGYRWRFSLGRGERRQLSATYTVTIPAKHRLRGGNRREG